MQTATDEGSRIGHGCRSMARNAQYGERIAWTNQLSAFRAPHPYVSGTRSPLPELPSAMPGRRSTSLPNWPGRSITRSLLGSIGACHGCTCSRAGWLQSKTCTDTEPCHRAGWNDEWAVRMDGPLVVPLCEI